MKKILRMYITIMILIMSKSKRRSDTEKRIIDIDLLNSLTTLQTIELIELCKAKLRENGIIRTDNILGDYTEYLVSRNLDLTLQNASSSGFDATDSAGVRYQIKGRRKSINGSIPHIKRFENYDFDYFVLVVFNRDFSIYMAGIVSKEHLTTWMSNKSKSGNSLNITKQFLKASIFRELFLNENLNRENPLFGIQL